MGAKLPPTQRSSHLLATPSCRGPSAWSLCGGPGARLSASRPALPQAGQHLLQLDPSSFVHLLPRVCLSSYLMRTPRGRHPPFTPHLVLEGAACGSNEQAKSEEAAGYPHLQARPPVSTWLPVDAF